MPISSTPTASEINVELGRAAGAQFAMGGAEERALAQVPSGPISFADFIGKSAQTPYEKWIEWLDANYPTQGGAGNTKPVNQMCSTAQQRATLWTVDAWAKTGGMIGTPVSGLGVPNISEFSALARMMQHSVETEAEFDAMIANQWRGGIQCENGLPNTAPYTGLLRNGYQSQADSFAQLGTVGCTAVWFDGTNGWRRRSYSGSGTPAVPVARELVLTT